MSGYDMQRLLKNKEGSKVDVERKLFYQTFSSVVRVFNPVIISTSPCVIPRASVCFLWPLVCHRRLFYGKAARKRSRLFDPQECPQQSQRPASGNGYD